MNTTKFPVTHFRGAVAIGDTVSKNKKTKAFGRYPNKRTIFVTTFSNNISSNFLSAEKWKKQATNFLNFSPSEIQTLDNSLWTRDPNNIEEETNLFAGYKKSPLFIDNSKQPKAAKYLTRVNQNLINKALFNKFWILCKESRIESPNRFYGSFYLGPFDESLSQTLAHNIRRTLLSELSGLAITSVEIDGVLHKFSNLPGIQETVLDILCNLQNIVFVKNETNGEPNIYTTQGKIEKLSQKTPQESSLALQFGGAEPDNNLVLEFEKKQAKGLVQKQSGSSDQSGVDKNISDGSRTIKKVSTKKFIGSTINNNFGKKMLNKTQNIFTIEQVGYLRARGPGVIKASDLILPAGIKCVNPDQHIATLAEDGILNLKIFINQGKNYIKQKQNAPTPLVDSSTAGSQNTTSSYVSFLKDQISQRTENNSVRKKTNRIYLDSVFMPVTKVNTIVQNNEKCTELETAIVSSYNARIQKTCGEAANITERERSSFEGVDFFKILNPIKSQEAVHQNFKEKNMNETAHITNVISERSINVFSEITQKQQKKQCHIVLEIWTNGSLHPRQALYECLGFLSNTFVTLENVKMLGSMFKSDYIYNKVLSQVEDKNPTLPE